MQKITITLEITSIKPVATHLPPALKDEEYSEKKKIQPCFSAQNNCYTESSILHLNIGWHPVPWTIYGQIYNKDEVTHKGRELQKNKESRVESRSLWISRSTWKPLDKLPKEHMTAHEQ